MAHRPGRMGFVLAASVLAAILTAVPVAAQRGGIGLGLTPTAERVFWADELALDDAWFYGGRASLGFGRYVALQGYYLEAPDAAGPAGDLETARRYGGEVVFTFADRSLAPFLSVGAGLLELGPGTGEDREFLVATGLAGIRLRLFDRLETRVFAQDLVFQVTSGSPLLAPGAIDPDDTRTLHNLVLGAGIDLRLGGESVEPETDRVFQDGVHAVRSPIELYAGEVRWDDGAAVADVTVGGARLGLDFGPYVGLRGYYFGSLDDGFDDFTDYFGYGAEGRFHLTRRTSALTPFLVLGGGRIHFPEAIGEASVFGDRRKWNAIAGGGVNLRLADRLHLQVAARDLVLSTAEPEGTTDPDQLLHNWLLTGGLHVSLGGGGGGDRPPVAAAPSPDRDESELMREVRALRAEVDSLRRDLRRVRARGEQGQPALVDPDRPVEEPVDAPDSLPGDSAAAAAGDAPAPSPAPRTIELPVLEEGVIYIRFGAEAARTADRAAAPAAALVVPADSPAVAVPDTLQTLLAELEARLAARAAAEEPSGVARAEQDRLARLEAMLSERLAGLEGELRALQRARDDDAPERVRVEVVDRPVVVQTAAAPTGSRGLFRGDRVGLHRLGPQVGVGFDDPAQLLLGLKVDVGSAFGGPVRVVPELVFGVTGESSWNLNGHLEWPLPLRLGPVRPWIGAGAGVLHDGSTRLMLPNVLVGLTHPLRDHQLFATLQGLDFFDTTRLLVGVQLRPPAFLRPAEPVAVAAPVAVPAAGELVAPAEPSPAEPEVPAVRDTSGIPNQPDIPDRAEEEPRGAPVEAPAEEAGTPEPPALAASEALVRELAELGGAPWVTAVRRTDRGVAVVLGGSGFFSTGDTSLPAGARVALRPLADRLIERPDVAISVEGHTDDRGAAALNETLSRRRAESVRDALVALGVAPARISVAGHGERRPIADNATAAGRADNRRVEVVVVPER